MLQKHALITGAAKRVGREVALSLARAGYNITLHYHTSKAEAMATRADIEATGRSCIVVQADLADESAIASLFHTSPPVSLLVHNAATFTKDTLHEVTQKSLHLHMQINCFAPILLSRYYRQHTDQNGHIICLLDGLQGWSMSAQFLSYALSKRALEQFIMLQAADLAPQCRLNGIRLGATLAGQMEKPASLQKFMHSAPMQSLSSLQECCEAILALEKLPSVTGQILDLSGGLHLV